MPRRIILSRRVRLWLDVQFEYLAARAPSAPDRLRNALGRAQRLLADYPHAGRRTEAPGVRRLVVAPYILRYREIGADLEIIDIRHSRQRERPIPDATE
jgi:plasmid stabilization system protein ParE